MAAPRTTAPKGSTGGNSWGTFVDVGGSYQPIFPGQAFPAGTNEYYVTVWYNPSQEDLAQGATGRQFATVQVDVTWTKGQVDLAIQNLMIERRSQQNWSQMYNPTTGKSSP